MALAIIHMSKLKFQLTSLNLKFDLVLIKCKQTVGQLTKYVKVKVGSQMCLLHNRAHLEARGGHSSRP